MKHLFNLVEITVEAITKPDRWTDLTNALVDHFEVPSATIFKSPFPGQPISKFFYSDELGKDAPARIVEHFTNGGDETDWAVYKKFLTAPAHRLVTEESIMGVERDTDLPFCTERNMMKRYLGVQSRLAAALNDIGPWRDVLALHSHQRTKDVSPHIFSEMNLLLPIIGKAMTTYRAFEILKRTFGARLGALDFLEFGAALVDRNGNILYGNTYFNEIMLERDGLQLNPGGKIEFLDRITAGWFTTLVEDACSPHLDLAAKTQSTLCARRKSNAEPYFMKIHSVRDGDNETGVNGDFALLFVIDPCRAGSLSDAGILEMGLLTKAEADICKLLLSGATTLEISEARGVTANTTRHQIKSILAKLRCRDRLNLYQIAFTTHLPVRSPTSGNGPA